MPQDGEIRVEIKPMPGPIAEAVLKVIKQVHSARPTGEGDDRGRQFRFAGINDVIDACHEALNEGDLHILPIEISCDRERENGRLWMHFKFKFRLIHKSHSWVDEENIHHISHTIQEDGMSSGKAQSLAWRNYVKGLLRIRTAEPDEQVQRDSFDEPAKVAKPAVQEKHFQSSPVVDGILFSFFYNKVATYTADQAETAFKKYIEPLDYADRKQWEGDEVNATGMRQLREQAPIVWQHIRKGLDRPDVIAKDQDVSRQATTEPADTDSDRETRRRSPRSAAPTRRPY